MAQQSTLMQGKRGVVLGVANNRSIAWGIAKACHAAGAEIALTWQGDALKKRVEPLAKEIGGLLLGPSLFGLLWPSAQHAIFPTDPVQKSMLDAVSELGVLMLRNTTRADIAPDQAILREAGRGYDLVVLGVSRRPGDVLFFGNTAAAVLERSPTSILFVAS